MCMSPETPTITLSPAAGSGIAAVRRSRLDSAGSASSENATNALDSHLRLKALKALEVVLLGEEVATPHAQGRPQTPDVRSRSPSVVESDDRVRMECTVCGYKSIPQWLNDEASCLKCQAVLKRRPSIHQRNGFASSHVQRPVTAPERKRSQSVSISRVVGNDRPTEGNETYHLTLLSSISSSYKQKSKEKEVSEGSTRCRMECTVCGYKSVPQWLNDEAHCLKCQAVLKRRPSIHQKGASDLQIVRSSQRRSSTPAKLFDKTSSRQLVGPERFFYDKSTYTGAHAHGGPR